VNHEFLSPAEPFARSGRPPSGRAGRTFQTRQRKLSPRQSAAYETSASTLRVLPRAEFIDQDAEFGRTAPLIVDLGFGLGDTTAAFARCHPDHNVVGIEVHRPGVANLAMLLDTQGSTNVRVIEADALDVLTWMVAPGSVDILATYFPDPWPKPSQRWRRLINESFADLVASRLRPGGRWLVATDSQDYATHALNAAITCERLVVPDNTFSARDDRRPVTKYERRGLREGRSIRDFAAIRRSDPPASTARVDGPVA
jgi:tRNA (guanine-N7-)-methyltransferase